MFGPLGTMEILFILVLALLVFGPRRLPEVGRTVGKALGEFRRATTDLKRSVNAELALEEERPLPRRPPAPRGLVGAEAEAAAGAIAVRPAAGAHPRSPATPPRVDGVVPEPGLSEDELLAANPTLGSAPFAEGDEAEEPADAVVVEGPAVEEPTADEAEAKAAAGLPPATADRAGG